MAKNKRHKSDFTKEEYYGTVKKFILFTVFMPIVYPLALAEGFFGFGYPLRATSLEFFDDWFQTLKLIFGGTIKDNSKWHSEYRFKLKAKSEKVDLDVSFAVLAKFKSKNKITFHQNEAKDYSVIKYDGSTEHSRCELYVRQFSKDEFSVEYAKDSYYSSDPRFDLNSPYKLNKEQAITLISNLKN